MLALLLLLLSSCTHAPDPSAQDDADDFAERLADDIADLAASAVDVVSTADDLQERDSDEACYPTVGTCSFCYAVDGTPLSGTFSLSMEATPCGAAWERAGRSVNYSVAETSLTGSWTATGLGGDYTVEASGVRTAVLSTSSPRGGDHDFDASYTATMTAGVVNLVVDSLTLDLTYSAFTGRVWDVAVALTDDALSGTATSDDGIACTVSAGVEAPTVSCTVPGA